MFGLPSPGLGHLTSSGTIANLEALWIAREVHPGKRIVHCAAAHYTHARMCELLGVTATRSRPTQGRIDLDAVQAECARGDVGTVVLTTGSTGLGAIDRVDEALALRERYGVRLHADGAYGGFFTLLARGDDPLVAPAPYAAIAQCDSVVVDPHKHGLQPYGCGAVLFADPAVQRVYRHDSPFTYFTEADLHLGEISLECSRAGAAAAGLWLTLQALPLERDEGLGAVLGPGGGGARWAGRLRSSEVLDLHVEPELDIVTYLPRAGSLSALDAASGAVLKAGMEDPDDPVFLEHPVPRAPTRWPRATSLEADADGARVLRSVLMKPEHEQAVPWLHGASRTWPAPHWHDEPRARRPRRLDHQRSRRAGARGCRCSPGRSGWPRRWPAVHQARTRRRARARRARPAGPPPGRPLRRRVPLRRRQRRALAGVEPVAYERALRASVAALAACSERLLLCTLPTDLGRPRAAPKPHAASAIVRAVAADNGAVLAELDDLAGPPWLLPDAVHPTARGQLEIADRAARALGAPQLPSTLIEVYGSRRARARFAARWGVMLARDLRRGASSACARASPARARGGTRACRGRAR